jgi:AraC-like DNA-binding protein
MQFRYFTSESALPHVRAMWTSEATVQDFNQRFPALPDPFPMLALSFGAPPVWTMPNGVEVELPPTVFFRPQYQALNVNIRRGHGNFKAIGLNIFAWGTRFVVDGQIDIGMPVVPLDEYWQDFARSLSGVLEQGREDEAVARLTQFLSDLYGQTQQDVMPVRNAVEQLHAANGQFDLKALASSAYLSPSQLERRFNYLLGISPKRFARLVRFDALMGEWLSNPARRMVDLVYQYGYANQSQFVHEFKAFTARTPREYMTYQRRRNADNPQVLTP